MKLPKSISIQVADADGIEKTIQRHLANSPPVGRPLTKTTKNKEFAIFVEDSEEELNKDLAILARVIGSKTQGNKRLGKQKLYADLIKAFKNLKSLGITLPKNKSLSGRAIPHGLGEVLRTHGLTKLSDNALVKNPSERQRIANANSGIFERVAGQLN